MLCLFPEQDKAWFVSFNTDHESANYERFNELLVQASAIEPAAVTALREPAADVAHWQGVYLPASSGALQFAAIDAALNIVRLHADGNTLRWSPLQSPPRLLSPAGGYLLREYGRSTASHVLSQSADGTRVISDGLRTHEQTSWGRLLAVWACLAGGLLGLAYMLLAGIWRGFRRQFKPASPAFVPMLGALALLLPAPWFLTQLFLTLGDATIASVLLAAISAGLPLAMLVGLLQYARIRPRGMIAMLDAVAMLAILQWSIAMWFWGLLPLRLWA